MENTNIIVKPGDFDPASHWYDKALNATIHPMVQYFLSLDIESIVIRYTHLHPKVDSNLLRKLLQTETKYFKWAGADLINVTTADGIRQMTVIENNSCPSGQKSMPLQDEQQEMGGYAKLIERTFLPYIKEKRTRIKGNLAVIFDKNPMEASGYAAAMAELSGEHVHLVSYYDKGDNSHIKWDDGILYVLDEKNTWQPIRAALRYLTQRPWNRLPLHTKTIIFNPIIACLAGGRNKMMASKAYDFFNADLRGSGLAIQTPATIWDVSKREIPLWVHKLGGHAVIKVPYSNAGQGVYTIVHPEELDEFMKLDFEYDKFIIQSLIGNYQWSSILSQGKFYHVGTIPDKKKNTYVADIRLMVSSTKEGIFPLGLYARRARKPLVDTLSQEDDSWSILGTNLSIKNEDATWASDTRRLLLADRRDFNKLGLSLDDLIEAYIQTVLSMKAIDSMCSNLYNTNNRFRSKLFASINNDEALIKEIAL